MDKDTYIKASEHFKTGERHLRKSWYPEARAEFKQIILLYDKQEHQPDIYFLAREKLTEINNALNKRRI